MIKSRKLEFGFIGKYVAIALSACLFMVSSPALSQEQIPVAKAAIVDLERILVESRPWKEAEAEMRDQIQVIRDDIEVKRGDIKARADELKRQQAILAPEVFQQKANALKQEQRQLQRDMQVTNAKLNEALQNIRAKMKQIIVQIATKLAREKGMNIGFDRADVVFFVDSIDISDETLKRFNDSDTTISTTTE